MCVGSGCSIRPLPFSVFHCFYSPAPAAPSLAPGSLLMCWKTEDTPPKRGHFLCILVLLEVIKRGFVLGEEGLLSLHLIYHSASVRRGPCCRRKNITNSRCTQHPPNRCQDGNWSPSSNLHLWLYKHTNTCSQPTPIHYLGLESPVAYCANTSSWTDNYFLFKPLKSLSYHNVLHFYENVVWFSVSPPCRWNGEGGAVLFCPSCWWNFSLWVALFHMFMHHDCGHHHSCQLYSTPN